MGHVSHAFQHSAEIFLNTIIREQFGQTKIDVADLDKVVTEDE